MRKDGLSMSGIYDATIYFEFENRVRNIIGTVTAATLKLKSYGFSDEAVYEIIPIVMEWRSRKISGRLIRSKKSWSVSMVSLTQKRTSPRR